MNDDDTGPPVRNTPRWRMAAGAALVCLICLAGASSVIALRQPGEPLAAVSIKDRAQGRSPAPPIDSAGGPGPIEPAEPDASGSPSKRADDSGSLIVHVAGAVRKPGVVELPAGSRTFEAIEEAGGALPDAALDAVNLAAPLTDGSQLYVPRVGQSPAAAPPGAAGGENTGDDAGPVNLNTASPAELEELPGVGPVLAERIVAWRQEHGGFSSVADLDAVSGVGEAMMSSLADLVTV